VDVTVKIYYKILLPGLPEDLPDRVPFTVKLPEGATVGALLSTLQIPQTLEFTALVNGAKAKECRPLKENDLISIFPPLAGG